MKDHAAIMVRHGEQFLFIQRAEMKKSLPNIWGFPTGTVEANESPLETAAREAVEELGIMVRPRSVAAVVELPELDARLHFILCEHESGHPAIVERSEIRSLRWLSFDEFYAEYGDDVIGHGLRALRSRQEFRQATSVATDVAGLSCLTRLT